MGGLAGCLGWAGVFGSGLSAVGTVTGNDDLVAAGNHVTSQSEAVGTHITDSSQQANNDITAGADQAGEAVSEGISAAGELICTPFTFSINDILNGLAALLDWMMVCTT